MPLAVRRSGVAFAPDVDDPMAHVCEPRMLRLRDGQILLAHRTGTEKGSPDGRPAIHLSSDEGTTWKTLGRPFDDVIADGWDSRVAALAEMPSGELIIGMTAFDMRIDRPVYNPETEGQVPIAVTFASSMDKGQSWSRPWPLEGHTIRQTALQGLLPLPGGDLLMTFETFKDYDEPGVWRYRGGLLRSHDNARTWGTQVISAASDFEGDPFDTMFWDPRIAYLSDGALVQFYYAFRHRTGGEGPVHAGWSEDEGLTWTPPSPTALTGQATFPIPLPGGRLVAFQQRRSKAGIMRAYFSPDGGRTFDPGSETIVYQQSDELAPGADGSLSAFDYLMSMDRFTFGHPCGVPLGIDRLLVAWYAGEDGRTSIRWAELELES